MTASTAVHSNAFNFQSFVQTGVDPRTGMYTASLSLRELLSNYLRGPLVELTLNYNPLNTLDSGYGKGWNLALTEYSPHIQVVRLYSGQSFKVTGPYAGVANRMRMKEQKIEDFQFYQLPGNKFEVVHKSGLVEKLELRGASPQVAVPISMHSKEGHEIILDYVTVNGAPMLSSIRDKNGLLLRINRDTVTKTVTIGLAPVNNTPSAEVVLNLKNDSIDRITLPSTERAGWRFEYLAVQGLSCISKVWTPFGAVETVEYKDAGHGFPGAGNEQRKLPRVTDHSTNPGSGQPPIVVKYSYSTNGNNFLGNGSGIVFTDDGMDNLYKVVNPYVYSTTERVMNGQSEIRSVTREFNRFHLLVSETTLQGTHKQTKKTHYYADDNDKLSFDQQPPQCQLPKETITRWELTDDARKFRVDTEKSEYDIHGNQTLSVQANGITEATSYYPAAGVAGKCPPDPYGFVRHIEQVTVSPATDKVLIPNLEGSAPTKKTRYSYIDLPPVQGSAISKFWVTESEVLTFDVVAQTETLVERKKLDYFLVPANPLTHGLTAKETVTLTTAGTDYVSTRSFEYSIKTDADKASKNKQRKRKLLLLGETTFATKETFIGHDNLKKVIDSERSLLNGEPLLTQDKDIIIRNTYDKLLRVLTETVAPDDPLYSATRTYSYGLVRPADDGSQTAQAWQEVENVKNVKTRSWIDGLTRVFKEEQQDQDFSNGAYRQIYQAKYNLLGQLVEESEIDWMERQDLKLTTTNTFDDWGQQSSSTDPAGVVQHTVIDPIAFTTTEWIEGMGKTVTTNNRLEKPVKVERFDLADKLISSHAYFNDGLGRTAREKNAEGYETSYTYDFFDRMLQTTLPTMDKVVREYAGHSQGDLPTLIKVGTTILGTQEFDSLERMTRSTTGGRITSYQYDTTFSKPDRVIQPTGDIIHYEYNHGLTEEPHTRSAVAGKKTIKRLKTVPEPITASYDYDPKDARLLNSSELDIEIGRTYDIHGEVKTETRKVKDVAKPYEMTYVNSRLGRSIRYHDVIGQVQTFVYNQANGQLTHTELGAKGSDGYIRSDFTYNAQGLNKSITTVDATNQQVKIELEYDDHARETLRTFHLNGSTSWLKQEWNGLDQITRRELSEGTRPGEVIQREETYRYELRGRLEEYRCNGPLSPVDPYGNVMTRQLFFFDALDNHEEVRTTYIKGPGTETNIARFAYANTDPVQLSSITNNQPGYPDIQLEYDANGNLIKDEEGRTLSYDLLSRLVEVSGPGSGASRHYSYDGGDQLSASGTDTDKEQRFYRGEKPVNSVSALSSRTYVSANDMMLAERQEGASPKSLVLTSDGNGSVIREVSKGEVREFAYTAYGYAKPANTDVGYNGEVRDSHTECYMLGNGYRAYSAVLMLFHKPDSWSPFGYGGLNAYAYVKGNPITNTDPTGHMLQPTRFIAQAVKEFAEEFSGPTRVATSEGVGTVTTTSGNAVSRINVSAGRRASGSASEIPPARPISERPPMPLPKPKPKSYLTIAPDNPVGEWVKQSNPAFKSSIDNVKWLDEVEIPINPSKPKSTSSATAPKSKSTKPKITTAEPKGRSAKPKETAAEKVNRIRAEKGSRQWDQ